MTTQEKIDVIINHIQNVQKNCIILGEKLIKNGEDDLGRRLIANGFIHDYSKFSGIEWDHLWTENEDKKALSLAISHHNRSNLHHPEAWEGGIKNMPRLYVAEMICDWKARSNEFGTSLVDWIDKDAMRKFSYTKQDKIYEEIIFFFSLLCDKPFTAVK